MSIDCHPCPFCGRLNSDSEYHEWLGGWQAVPTVRRLRKAPCYEAEIVTLKARAEQAELTLVEPRQQYRNRETAVDRHDMGLDPNMLPLAVFEYIVKSKGEPFLATLAAHVDQIDTLTRRAVAAETLLAEARAEATRIVEGMKFPLNGITLTMVATRGGSIIDPNDDGPAVERACRETAQLVVDARRLCSSLAAMEPKP